MQLLGCPLVEAISANILQGLVLGLGDDGQQLGGGHPLACFLKHGGASGWLRDGLEHLT